MVLRQFESKQRTDIFVVLYDDGLCTSTSSCYFYFVLNLTNLIKMFLLCKCQCMYYCLLDLKSQMQYVFLFTWFEVTDAVWVLLVHDLKSQMQYVFLCSHMQFVFFCLHDMKSQMQYVFFDICLYQILTALKSWRLCLLQCESAFRIMSILF